MNCVLQSELDCVRPGSRRHHLRAILSFLTAASLGLVWYYGVPRVYRSRSIVEFPHAGAVQGMQKLSAPAQIERAARRMGVKENARDIQLKRIVRTACTVITPHQLEIDVWAANSELARHWAETLIEEARLPNASTRLIEMSDRPISPRGLNVTIVSLAFAVLAYFAMQLIEHGKGVVANSAQAESLLAVRHLDGCADNGKSLRAALFATPLSIKPPQVFMIAAGLPNEGKSIVARDLAADCARAGKKTLLIDTDFQTADLHRLFGLRRTPGLTEFFGKETVLEKACRPTSYERLSLIAAGRLNPGANEFAVEEFVAMLTTLRQQYDVIVVDTPPLLTCESRLPAPCADGILFVVRGGQTLLSNAKAALGGLRREGASIYGFVLTEPEPAEEPCVCATTRSSSDEVNKSLRQQSPAFA